MLLQYVAGIGLERFGEGEVNGEGYKVADGGPEGLILNAGIYNLPLLLRNHSPPTSSPEIAAIYSTIASGAFGPDSSNPPNPTLNNYLAVSPISGTYTPTTWPNGKLIVLAHSYDDELVERAQRDVMCVALDRQGWSIVMEEGDEEARLGTGKRVLEVRDVRGSHDFEWRDGEGFGGLVGEMVGRLVG